MSLLTFIPATPESGGSGPASSPHDFEPAGEMTNLTFAEATELLDLLERRGVQGADVEISEAGLVTVRWAA